VADDPLMRIGPFSRASWISVKALRAYHEAGLLVPAAVDESTGYRSYSIAQLTDAAVIRQLRQLDVPLEAIREVLMARDPAVTRKVLAEHGAVLEERLVATQRVVNELHAAIEVPSLHTPVHRRHETGRTVVLYSSTINEADFEPFLTVGFAILEEAVAMSGAVIDGPYGGCYPTVVDDDAQDVAVFIPVTSAPLLPAEVRAAGARIDELPATDVAVIAHHGDYDHLEDTYRELGAWVAAHAEPAEDLPVRELYLVGWAQTDDPAAFRTEICWPIRSAPREKE